MKAPATCPCCKQLIPPLINLPIIKQRIYDYVSTHPSGVTTAQILDYVYAEDPNGGPDSPCIRAHVYQMNKKHLRPFGVFLRASDYRVGAKYTLRVRELV